MQLFYADFINLNNFKIQIIPFKKGFNAYKYEKFHFVTEICKHNMLQKY